MLAAPALQSSPMSGAAFHARCSDLIHKTLRPCLQSPRSMSEAGNPKEHPHPVNARSWRLADISPHTSVQAPGMRAHERQNKGVPRRSGTPCPGIMILLPSCRMLPSIFSVSSDRMPSRPTYPSFLSCTLRTTCNAWHGCCRC